MSKLEFYLHNRFRNKLFLSYLLIALIPVVINSLLSGGQFVSQTRQLSLDHTRQITSQVNGTINVYISTLDRLANFIVLELQHSTMIDPNSPIRWDQSDGFFQNILNQLAVSHPEIAGILIASQQDSYISTGLTRISRDPFHRESWFQQASAAPDKIVLLSSAIGRNIATNEDYSADDVFSLAKAIVDPVTNQLRGVLLLDIHHTIIQDSINNVTIGENGFVYVVDKAGEIVYTPVNPIVYRVNPAWLTENGQGTVTAQIDKNQYHIQSDASDYTGWRTIGVFPLKEVMSGVHTSVQMLLLSLFVALGLVFIASLQVSKSVTRPLTKLQGLMKQAESGNLSVRFNSRYQDEIGELGNSFNHMIEQINHLIEIVTTEQEQKRSAEIISLQQQIKPHFLYNTLDTISWMARDHGANDVVRLIDALSNMYRIGLSQGRENIPLHEEIRHVSNYLYIQKIRYKEKLNYSIDIDPTLDHLIVPKLMLQPLVENAIYHGLKLKRGGGTILIQAVSTEDDYCELSVTDTGAGISAKKLAELQAQITNASIQPQKMNSFGLFYVQSRLHLLYGNRANLSIESIPEQGTTARMRIPLHSDWQQKEIT